MSLRSLSCLVLVAMGCVPDDSDCGRYMHFAEAIGVCACDDNAIAGAGECIPCADDEVVTGTTCGCAAGQAKDPSGVCALVHGLGARCDDTIACDDATYDFCSVRDGVGSCTQHCVVDTDCPGSYVCTDWEATPSCRAYTGFGTTCVASTDCAAFDADQCLQGYCVVAGCSVDLDDCPRGTDCCDYTSLGFGTLCVPSGSCS